MNELVFVQNDQVLTDSMRIAEAFQKVHKRVLQDIRELQCSDDFSRRNFVLTSYEDKQGKSRPMYFITQDGFTMLVMGYTGKMAMEFKEKYIHEFNRMKDHLHKQVASHSYTIEDPIKRAEKWIEEQKEKLMLEQRVKEYEPKVNYVDKILASRDTVNISQIAQDYGLSGKKLNDILHEEKVQYKMNGQWLLYSKHQNQGYTKSKTNEYRKTDGSIGIKLHTRWTQKGRLFIHEILKRRGIKPLLERTA